MHGVAVKITGQFHHGAFPEFENRFWCSQLVRTATLHSGGSSQGCGEDSGFL